MMTAVVVVVAMSLVRMDCASYCVERRAFSTTQPHLHRVVQLVSCALQSYSARALPLSLSLSLFIRLSATPTPPAPTRAVTTTIRAAPMIVLRGALPSLHAPMYSIHPCTHVLPPALSLTPLYLTFTTVWTIIILRLLPMVDELTGPVHPCTTVRAPFPST